MRNNIVLKTTWIRLIICVIVIFNTKFLLGQKGVFVNDSLQILFYNVENLFDISDDATTNDDEFTTDGARRWTALKYRRKINRISQAIITFASYRFPEIIGLCEVENKQVLNDLVNTQLLNKAPYKIIHEDSPDKRGIDVALIYDSTRIKPCYKEFIPIVFFNGDYSRDILYLKVKASNNFLHLFVNHWPSRYTGARNTDVKRLEVAGKLLAKCDSVLKSEPQAKIIIMGDFNDEPDDESVREVTEYKLEHSKEKCFYNLMAKNLNAPGTIKFQSIWSVFDQFIVSSGIQHNNDGFGILKTEIAQLGFLFQDDEKYLGKMPFRTFYGFQYLGGFSDHLPIKLILNLTQ